MASNSNLIKSIEDAANRKGLDVPETEGLTNVQLTAALRDLNEREDAPAATLADKMFATAAAQNADEAEDAPDGSEVTEAEKSATLARMREEADEAEDAPAAPFSVAAGKALTCKRGMIAEGEEISAEDFPGGEERLAELVESGHVVKA